MMTLRDKLSRLSYRQACKLLGPQGERLLRVGGRYEIDLTQDVSVREDMFRLQLREAAVTIRLDSGRDQGLLVACSACSRICEHIGAALALILEEKLALGLSAPPTEKTPVEHLSDQDLIRQAIREREERARTEKMDLHPLNGEGPWTDYRVTNRLSGKSYRVALRGCERGESYCSCPDYRKNTLGTCKHILFALRVLKKKYERSVWQRPYEPSSVCVYLRYGETLDLRLLLPSRLDSKTSRCLRPFADKPVKDVKGLLRVIREVQNAGIDVTVYPDADEYIQRLLYADRVRNQVEEIRKDPVRHPLRKTLLKTELLPYQLDGIAFAVGAGRAVLADDMGLGKTIQGIGVAELLARNEGISKVLVICPASLKSQWRTEIARFSNRSCQLVLGSASERARQYRGDAFFVICNYEQVLRDIKAVEAVRWDLIILDEGQRIKNWEAKTSRVIKALKSPFALVLSGTPLENRLDELYSVVEFIDERRLGPAFRFYNRYRTADERGRVLGYRNLDDLREKLRPVLLRRTRKMVAEQLPPRTTEIRRIPPTEEQLQIHDGQKRIIRAILNKKYFTEMDFLRLQKALLTCRMAANSTFLVDKTPPGYSSKLKELDALLDALLAEEERKILLFSEWTTMLDIIEPSLKKRGVLYVRLDGSVPQKGRQELIQQFNRNPACRMFLTTNAGSTGLNLQAANTVINVDLPWNPAVLEQRISRAHRMGQRKPVQVFLLVTESTLEESLLGTLSAKHELALAVLDPEAEATEVDLFSGMEELKRRLETLLGEGPEAAQDESLKEKVEGEAKALGREDRIASAGGQLVSAAFTFIGELFSGMEETEQSLQVEAAIKKRLFECLERGEDGRIRMKVTLPDTSTLEGLSRALARLIMSSGALPTGVSASFYG